MALRKLLPLHCTERAIVFVSTQQTANEMGMGKIAEILDAQALHGGMRQSEREVVMKNFREGLQRVLIATDVAARGIDVPNVDCVIHFDTDLDNDKYVHRAGRCGRAGKDGVSIILANHNEKHKIRELEKSIGRKIEPVSIPDDREVLHSVMHRLLGTLLAKKQDTYAAMVPYAKEILKREDSEQLISAALASITGYDKMSEYSLLSGIEGKITVQLKKTRGFFTVKSAIYFVKEIAGVNTQVNHVSISEEDKSIFLDVNKDIADLIMLEYNAGTLEELTGEKGVEVHLPNMLPPLIPYEPEQYERSPRSSDRGRGRGGGGFSRSDEGRPRRQQRDDGWHGTQQRDSTPSRKRFSEYENMPYKTRERKHHILTVNPNKFQRMSLKPCCAGLNEPCMDCQKKACDESQQMFLNLQETLGLSDPQTLEAGIDLFDQYIIAYKLTECDNLLSTIVPECRKRGSADVLYIKGIQALAFLRFKQGRYQECSSLFEEILVLLGPSAALLENMGHAYNSLSNDEKAEYCFTKAKELIEESGDIQRSNLGGVLMGLGLVKRHRNKTEEALPILKNAYEFYKARHEGDHSLCAKAAMAVAGACEELQYYDEAEANMREAIRVFRVTCGDESPLTANALAKLGFMLWEIQKWDAAEPVLKEALKRCAEVDKYSVHLPTVARITVFLYRIYSESDRHKENADMIIAYCRETMQKIEARDEKIPENIDTAVLHKVLGELCFIAGRRGEAGGHFSEALRIMKPIPGPESQQIQEFCSTLIPFCH